ncbi:MAG: hypothetical protein V8R80_02960 [Eubacterium sp.]
MRDYIHVVDLAIGHVRSVEKRQKKGYPFIIWEQAKDILYWIW